MQFTKICVDLDDTLAEFSRGVWELCGLHPDTDGEFSEQDRETMWEAVRNCPGFYRNLKECEAGMALFRALRKKYGDRVEILSAVPSPERGVTGAEPDKRQWVKEHLGEEIRVNIARSSRDKADYVTDAGCVLIDDLYRNVRAWREAGGIGILFRKDDPGAAGEELRKAGL